MPIILSLTRVRRLRQIKKLRVIEEQYVSNLDFTMCEQRFLSINKLILQENMRKLHISCTMIIGRYG